MLKLLRNVGAGRVCAANRRLFSTAATRSAFVQVFNGPKATPAFESKDMPLPTLGEGEVLVKTELATICGSDLHTILGTRKEPTPLVLGHEAVGIVVETGLKPASHVKVGDRITWSIADSCGTCPPCTDYDLPQKCDKLFKYGHASITDGTGLNGCYGTHIIVRKGTHITKVPSHLPLGLVAPANCALATVCNALDIPIRKTDTTALVQGAGLLGLYSCALLKTKGFKTVFCTDIHPGRLEMVKEFGAVPLPGDALQRKVRQEAIQNAAPHGVDICVEVAGSSSLVPEAIQTLRFGGHYALVGMVHPHSQLTSTTGEMIIRKCITIRGSHNYAPRHLDQAIEFLSKHHKDFPFHKLISPPFSLRDLEQAVKEAESQKWARVSIDPTR